MAALDIRQSISLEMFNKKELLQRKVKWSLRQTWLSLVSLVAILCFMTVEYKGYFNFYVLVSKVVE